MIPSYVSPFTMTVHHIYSANVLTSWKSAIIEGAVVVLCPVEVLSRRQTQHQHKHMAHTECTVGQHFIPQPAAKPLFGCAAIPH